MNKPLSILSAAILALSMSAGAQAMTAGDIAVIAFNSDGDDNFAWVALTDIAANSVINFTDASWQATAFRSTEHLDVGGGGPLTWSNTSMLSAGSVVSYSGKTANTWSVGSVGGVGLSLATSGDQIFAYQGSNASPSFIYGLQFAHAAGIVDAPAVSNSTNTTNIPGGLSLAAGTMLDVGDFDDGYYLGATSGSQTELLAALSSASNWTTGNTEYASSSWKTAFTVTTPVPEADTYALLLAGLGLLGVLARRRKVN